MKSLRSFHAILVAAALAAPGAWAAEVPGGDFARLSAQYAGWAGGKANADNLVGGLSSGSSITLVTSGDGRPVSIAGFKPSRPLAYREVRSALGGARDTLARLGIARPSAEQIQAALIGGDVEVAGGTSRQVAGVIAPLG
jgi:hypothetical protein